MSDDPNMILSRRKMVAGIIGLTLGPSSAAHAQIKFDFGKIGDIGRMLKGLNLDEQDEISLGEGLFGPLIGAMGGIYRNSASQQAVSKIATGLFETSQRAAFSWEIVLLDNNEVNAWALPGGKIGVNKGLLRYITSEDELAAVIAHEMGHAEFSHAASEMRRKSFYQGLSQAGQAAAISALDGTEKRVGASVGMKSLEGPMLSLVTSGYSRSLEAEADMHIVSTFAKAGYDVKRGAGFYETLLELIPPGQAGTTSLFAGHPETKKRLATLRGAGSDTTTDEEKVSYEFFILKETFPTRKIYKRTTD